jgi:hypothetical protein
MNAARSRDWNAAIALASGSAWNSNSVPRSASIVSRSATSTIKRMPLGTAAPYPPRPSVRWVRAPRTGRGRARGAPRTSPYSKRIAQDFRPASPPDQGTAAPDACENVAGIIALREATGPSHLRARRAGVMPGLVRRRPQRGRVVEDRCKGGCSLGHPFDPVSIPHDIENRGVATRIDQERNPPVSGAFQRSPQVTEAARLNLSRWRHGFEPALGLRGQSPRSGH